MKRIVFALLAALLVSARASAQIDLGSASITAASSGGGCTAVRAGCAEFSLVNQNAVTAVTLQVTGTFSQTLTFEGTSSADPTTGTWFTLTVTKLSDGSYASTTTTTGQFSVSNTGLTGIRARCTSFSSGTAVVSAVRGYAQARALGPFFSSITFANGTVISDSASGKFLITGTTPMIQLGGTSSSFVAIKQNGTALDVKLADDSANAAINAASINTTGSSGVTLAATGALFVGNNKLINSVAPSAPSSCGTSPAVTTTNGASVWVVTGGTGGTATGCTITMPAATTGWVCSVVNITQTAAHRADRGTVQTASTTTSVTWEYVTLSTGAATAFTASDVFRGICFAY